MAYAALVLESAPDLADIVIAGKKTLNEAYEEAQNHSPSLRRDALETKLETRQEQEKYEYRLQEPVLSTETNLAST